MNPAFWKGKRVLLTGHTGFKGAWLAHWLGLLDADVTGYSLAPATAPAVFSVMAPWPTLESVIGDVRNRDSLGAAIASSRPEIVIHLAAQALVGESYANPVETFSSNVMGTVNLLSLLRGAPSAKVILIVTSDKVYRYRNDRPSIESDALSASSPYAASKVAQELIATAFAASYFDSKGVAVATSRAGNVIGGGDWAVDRLVPDYFRSINAGAPLELRNPSAIRPWQHVLDALAGYLMFAERLSAGADIPRALNFGPGGSALSVAEVVAKLDRAMGRDRDWVGAGRAKWLDQPRLELDSAAARQALGWQAQLDIDHTIDWTVDWHRAYEAGEDMRIVSSAQIETYMQMAR